MRVEVGGGLQPGFIDEIAGLSGKAREVEQVVFEEVVEEVRPQRGLRDESGS